MHAPNAFVIPLLPRLSRQREQLWEALSRMSFSQRTARVCNDGIVATLGCVPLRRATDTDTDDLAGATLAQFMSAHGVGDQCPIRICG